MSSSSHTPSAVVTYWYVTTAEPLRILQSQPKADRGFGRKLLAQMNPTWPITPIGQFALNRSAQASANEFYIAGFPGLAVLQTFREDATRPSEFPAQLRSAVPAADVYALITNEDEGLGGFAHWTGAKLQRSFCATRNRVYEDQGLPEPFEAPYWSGERAEPLGGIALPFRPLDLVAEAQRVWLGFDLSEENDINVVAYAVDGRPEPKMPPHPRALASPNDVVATASAKLGLGEHRREYDDYETHEAPDEPQVRDWLQRRYADGKTVAAKAASRLRAASVWAKDRIRHIDRP